MVPGETSVLPSRLAADVAGGARATELEKLGLTCREEHAFDLPRGVRNVSENMAGLWLSGLSIHGDSGEMLHARVLTAHPSPGGDADAQPRRICVSCGSGAPRVSTPCRAEGLSEGLSDGGLPGLYYPVLPVRPCLVSLGSLWAREGSCFPCMLMEGMPEGWCGCSRVTAWSFITGRETG